MKACADEGSGDDPMSEEDQNDYDGDWESRIPSYEDGRDMGNGDGGDDDDDGARGECDDDEEEDKDADQDQDQDEDEDANYDEDKGVEGADEWDTEDHDEYLYF
ncbi:uncharacterized protein F5147DRAFT_656389 [Suillus discolor]|uniref:Uncharacterized protein n=1 Tax=Suillus discolor TaxID=1912936 RepID=A0A9P7EZ87_9AGAM|nr:uncharacterized protein F5147DRAFT_656389 [Suillus discolor]KAG2097253.1 hypothetical protein F5147DRAFT_656389 [Suillus discolor]